jgi:hypothetical protein
LGGPETGVSQEPKRAGANGQVRRGFQPLSKRLLDGEYCWGPNRLAPEPLQLVIGDGDPWRWPPEAMERGREQAEAGYHPWFCQACAGRTCSTCGAPLRSPVGCTALGAEGTYGPHSPILGARIPCNNPDCPSRPENR